VVFAGVFQVLGQAPSIPDSMPARGILPTGGYKLSDIETVNVANGNMIYQIPITSLPPGRAGWSAGVSLIYNSQVYDLSFTQMASINDPGTQANFALLQTSQTGGGWQLGYSYGIDVETRPWTGTGFSCTDATNQPWKFYRIFIVSPDGGHHTLHLYPYSPNLNSSPAETYSDVAGEGYYDAMPGMSSGSCSQTNPLAAGNITYYTSDGSYIRVVFNNTPGQYFSNIPWTMYFPDGRTVTGYGGTTTAMYDRNGNGVYITNNYDPSNPGIVVTTTLQDDLATQLSYPGRTITITYAANGGPADSVTQTGADAGQTPLTWTINWITAMPGQNLQYVCSDQGDYCIPNPQNGSYPLNEPVGYNAVNSLVLPTGQSFSFGYDTNVGWGELNSVSLPSGASVSYGYSEDNSWKTAFDQTVTQNPVTSKTLAWTDENAGIARQETTMYCVGFNAAGRCTPISTVTNPDGGQIHYAFTSLSYSGNVIQLVASVTWPDGSTEEKIWAENRPLMISSGFGIVYPGNPYVQYEIRSVASGGTPTQAAIQSFSLDRNGNQTQIAESDWMAYGNINHSYGVPTGFTGGVPTSIRTTTNTYYVTTMSTAGFSTDDTNGYFHPGMNSPWGLGTGKVVSGVGAGSSSTYAYGDSSGHLNLVTENDWDSQNQGAWRPTTYTYDSYGNVLTIHDPLQNLTTFTYFTDGACLKTKSIAGLRNFSYTCNGNSWNLVGTSTDSDNAITSTYSYDPYGRVTSLLEAGSGPPALSRNTATRYFDSARYTIVSSDLNTNGDGLLKSYTYYDQLGRVRKAVDPSGNTVETSYYTGPSNSYVVTSNPFVTQTETTMGWTLATLDRNGRTATVQHFTGSALPAPWGSNSTSTGSQQVSYSSSSTTNADEAGISRTTTVDGLGRITAVTENGNGKTVTYSYDALNDLTGVTHPTDATQTTAQTRSYVYSSMKNLLSASNPESGTITYTYDGAGNLSTRVLGGITTTYTYDGLKELTSKTFSDYNSSTPTPWATYTYSGGRRTSGAAGTTYTNYSYDALGRVSSSYQRQTDTNITYNFPDYNWNLADGLLSEQYPSGRVITTSRDGVGRISAVTGVMGGVVESYVVAGSTTYAPTGAMTGWTGGDGISRSYGYNSRLAINSVTASNQSGQLLGLTLTYSSTNDNGNVQSITMSRPGFGATTSFGYDGENRLTSAAEGSNWNQTYVYDVVGNQALLGTSSVIASALTPQTPNTTTVPFNTHNQWMAAGYDSATGHLNAISTQTFTWDAEQRLIQQNDSGPPATSASFSYDADGRRTEKTAGGITTVYVYDAMGNLAAEYGGTTPAVLGTHYLTQDNLGSTRMTTNASGGVVSCHDYLPFGSEIPSGWGRNGIFCYGQTSETTLKFTGKERDAETGLDYFGARYFSGAQGRFTSPDPENLGSILGDPQSWNGYAYGRNNPLKFTDPFGLNYTVCDAGHQNCGDLTDQQYAQYLQDSKNIVQRSNPDPNTNSLYVNNPNGSSTFLGTAAYYNERDVAAAQQISRQAGPVVNTLAALTLAFVQGPGLATLGGAAPEIVGLGIGSRYSTGGSPSTPVGRRGNPMDVTPGTNSGTTIGGRNYTGHALDQMQGRGAVPSAVEDTIRNGTSSPGRWPNTTKFSTSQMDVVTNSNGDVVTVIVRSAQ
jgi:RHS repeat-associated protein